MSWQRAGEKLVPRAFRTVVNTLMSAVSLARHCSGVELSSGGIERSSDTPANSWWGRVRRRGRRGEREEGGEDGGGGGGEGRGRRRKEEERMEEEGREGGERGEEREKRER